MSLFEIVCVFDNVVIPSVFVGVFFCLVNSHWVSNLPFIIPFCSLSLVFSKSQVRDPVTDRE